MDDFEYLRKATEVTGAHPYNGIVYKYTSFDTALLIAENQSLRFSSPLEFNDPFELSNSLIDWSFSLDEIQSWVNIQFPDMNNNQRRAKARELHKNPKIFLHAMQETMKEQKKKIGICCFSKNYLHPLMWAHYAQMHKGVCLGFNIQPYNNDDDFIMLGVAYADEIKPLKYFKERHFAPLKWMFTKSSIWDYEQEVRALYNLRNGDILFKKEALREVHFGVRTTEQERKDYLEKLKSLNYSIKKATVMEINPHTWDLKEKIILSNL